MKRLKNWRRDEKNVWRKDRKMKRLKKWRTEMKRMNDGRTERWKDSRTERQKEEKTEGQKDTKTEKLKACQSRVKLNALVPYIWLGGINVRKEEGWMHESICVNVFFQPDITTCTVKIVWPIAKKMYNMAKKIDWHYRNNKSNIIVHSS